MMGKIEVSRDERRIRLLAEIPGAPQRLSFTLTSAEAAALGAQLTTLAGEADALPPEPPPPEPEPA